MPPSLYLKLARRDVIAEDEKLALLGMFGAMRSVTAKQEVVSPGYRPTTSMLLVDGANRTLQNLRKRKVMTWNGGRLQIDDWEALQEIAEFDPTYLCLTKEPR